MQAKYLYILSIVIFSIFLFFGNYLLFLQKNWQIALIFNIFGAIAELGLIRYFLVADISALSLHISKGMISIVLKKSILKFKHEDIDKIIRFSSMAPYGIKLILKNGDSVFLPKKIIPNDSDLIGIFLKKGFTDQY